MIRFKIKNRIIRIRSPFIVDRLPDKYTYGLTNKLEDNYFVLFLDYDLVEYKVVLDDIKFLQTNYDIGTALIRFNKNYEKQNTFVGNFHVIFFTKFLYPDIVKLINLTRCDSQFKRGSKYQQRCWVLRLGKKKSANNEITDKQYNFYKIIKAKTSKTASTGLIKFFSMLDDIDLTTEFIKQDNLYNIDIINYVT